MARKSLVNETVVIPQTLHHTCETDKSKLINIDK